MSLDAANNYKTKKQLKESIGQQLMAYETSIYANEYKDNGCVQVVGPDAYRNRKWYATVTMQDGLIKGVK